MTFIAIHFVQSKLMTLNQKHGRNTERSLITDYYYRKKQIKTEYYASQYWIIYAD